MKVAGKNVVVLINDGGVDKLYACAKSATLNVTTEVIETSMPGNGKFASFLPTKNGFTGTLEGVTTLEEPTMLTLVDLRQKQLDQVILTVMFQRTDGSSYYTNKGNFIITTSTDVGSFDDMNLFTINLQGTGPLLQSIIPPPTTTPFDYRFGWIGINTVDTGPGYVPLTEADFIASLGNVFTDGAQYMGTGADTNDPVTVDDFHNTVDKVPFLQVPKSQLSFTKWSEIGNPLQQNQPIDAVYNYGSGAVWFLSEVEAGKWTYLTYYQTTFTGPLIFSR